jgi:hypothetical protein
MNDLYNEIRERTRKLLKGQDILGERVRIRARALSTEEAIGNPEADDFPLQKGKERIMQAEFGHALGQAFTDRYGDFEGTLEEVLQMALENNFRRAIFMATLNAVLRHMNRIDRTVHCRDQGPDQCAEELAHYIKTRYGSIRIVLIGFQPRMVESLAPYYPLRVIDMDPDSIGTRKFHVTIEGPEATQEAIRWTDLLLVTGTTLVNGTIGRFLESKPVIFYGTTIAGAAHLMGWDRFCAKGT